MRMRKAEGEVLVNDDKDKSLKVREDLALYSGYGVETKAASYSWVDLDSVKLLKMDESSRIGIEKDGGSLKVQLENGNIFFNVTEPLKDDESMEIRTSTMAIGIRGTCGWVGISEDGTTRIYLLEGKVECTAGDRSAFVSAGETAYIDGKGEITVKKFDAYAIPQFVKDELEQDEALMQAVPSEHEWADATYTEPKTCSICGETEGERKLSYFEEHGVEVPDGPVAGTVNGVVYNRENPEQYQKVVDTMWEQLSCSRMPAEEDGYDLITLELHMAIQLLYDGSQRVNYTVALVSAAAAYDWYTGRMFPARAAMGDDKQEYSTVVEVDGKSYDVSYSKETRWEQEDWIEDGAGGATSKENAYVTYTFKVPEGYDGLVLCIDPKNEYRKANTETMWGTDETPRYASDKGVEEGALFFRINREGGMSIEGGAAAD